MCSSFFNDIDLNADHDFILAELQKLYKPSSFDEQINITRGYNMALG